MLLHDISSLEVPAIFINAGKDIRPNWPTVQLAHLLKNGEYIEITSAGHYIWITHRDELRKELRATVERIMQQALPTET